MTKTTVSLLPHSLPLSSNQTCNYSVGQRDPHWPTVKYDHQFGPYPFIAVPLPPNGAARCCSPPQASSSHRQPFHPPLHLTPLNCHGAKRQDEEYRQALSPRNELLSLLTPHRYPLGLTSANHLGFFFLSFLLLHPPLAHHDQPSHF